MLVTTNYYGIYIPNLTCETEGRPHCGWGFQLSIAEILSLGRWTLANVPWQLMAASRAESDKVTGTAPTGSTEPLCPSSQLCRLSHIWDTRHSQRTAGSWYNTKIKTTAQREGSGCNCPAFSWAFCFPHLVLGPCRAAPENVALAGTSLDGDRSFQTELESP